MDAKVEKLDEVVGKWGVRRRRCWQNTPVLLISTVVDGGAMRGPLREKLIHFHAIPIILITINWLLIIIAKLISKSTVFLIN